MNSQTMRKHAEHCFKLANETADETQRMRYLRAARTWLSVAENKERLDEAMVPQEAKPATDFGNVA